MLNPSSLAATSVMNRMRRREELLITYNNVTRVHPVSINSNNYHRIDCAYCCSLSVSPNYSEKD